jgi:hypothetical protein
VLDTIAPEKAFGEHPAQAAMLVENKDWAQCLLSDVEAVNLKTYLL